MVIKEEKEVEPSREVLNLPSETTYLTDTQREEAVDRTIRGNEDEAQAEAEVEVEAEATSCPEMGFKRRRSDSAEFSGVRAPA
jgi:outer membrane protein TolC